LTRKRKPKVTTTPKDELDLFDDISGDKKKTVKRKSAVRKSSKTKDTEALEVQINELRDENADLIKALTEITQELEYNKNKNTDYMEEIKKIKSQYNDTLDVINQQKEIISKIEKKQKIMGKGTYKFIGGNRKEFPVADKLAFAMIEFSRNVGKVFEDTINIDAIPDFIHFEIVNYLMLDEIDLLKKTLEKVSSEYEAEAEE